MKDVVKLDRVLGLTRRPASSTSPRDAVSVCKVLWNQGRALQTGAIRRRGSRARRCWALLEIEVIAVSVSNVEEAKRGGWSPAPATDNWG